MSIQHFHLPVRSSWISSLTYWPHVPVPTFADLVEQESGFLLIVRKDGTGTLYAGISESVASELAGIGKVDHSVGKAYHRLFRAGRSLEDAKSPALSQQLNAQQVAEALEAYKVATAVSGEKSK